MPEIDSFGNQASADSANRDRAVDEELGLSSELQVLAAHLRGEADALAERYSPTTGAISPPALERRFARRWLWQAMAVGVAGVALLAWQIDRWQESPPASPSNVVASTTTPSVVVAAHHDAVHPAPLAAVPPSKVVSANSAAEHRSHGIAEVGIEGPAVERHPPADQVEMLRIQAIGFEKVIRKLQAELVARDAAQIESQRQIQSLQEQVLDLRKQLDDSRR